MSNMKIFIKTKLALLCPTNSVVTKHLVEIDKTKTFPF